VSFQEIKQTLVTVKVTGEKSQAMLRTVMERLDNIEKKMPPDSSGDGKLRASENRKSTAALDDTGGTGGQASNGLIIECDNRIESALQRETRSVAVGSKTSLADQDQTRDSSGESKADDLCILPASGNRRLSSISQDCEVAATIAVDKAAAMTGDAVTCKGLTTLAVDLAAMMVRIDNTLVQFESLRDQLQQWTANGSCINGNGYIKSRTDQGLAEVAGSKSFGYVFTGQDDSSVTNAIQRKEVLDVIEAARADAAAIAASSVAMERAVNLELVSQLRRLVDSESFKLEHPSDPQVGDLDTLQPEPKRLC
jgi:hypothetical protein